MAEHKRRMRVDCEEQCRLLLRDSSYLATVKNISFGGALIHFYESLPDLHVGDRCKVRMNGESIREYSCEVVRIGTSDVAVMFSGVERLFAVMHTL